MNMHIWAHCDSQLWEMEPLIGGVWCVILGDGQAGQRWHSMVGWGWLASMDLMPGSHLACTCNHLAAFKNSQGLPRLPGGFDWAGKPLKPSHAVEAESHCGGGI